MTRYVLMRLALLLPVLLLASVLIFLLIHLIPGDPATTMLGIDAPPEQIEALRERLGLRRPLPVQYTLWLGRAVQGDLGTSFSSGLPVSRLLLQKLPPTLQLSLGALVLSVLIAVPAGIVAAVGPASTGARLVLYGTSLSMAIPTFWLGILLVLFVGLRLGWLPTSGYVPFLEDPAQALRLLILPAITLSAYVAAVLTRFLSTALVDALNQDYIRTARAKGLRARAVVVGHALRNALIPFVTALGLQFGTFMGGAVITEAIFDYPGIGRLLLQAVLTRDYVVVQGTLLFVVTGFVIVNLITDLVYAALDPRIRYA
ncbi:MAG: ABC transporter permease [Chloroflexi bacterium]|nr:ABC transporter permease [Chloroflexota bacterium]